MTRHQLVENYLGQYSALLGLESLFLCQVLFAAVHNAKIPFDSTEVLICDGERLTITPTPPFFYRIEREGLEPVSIPIQTLLNKLESEFKSQNFGQLSDYLRPSQSNDD